MSFKNINEPFTATDRKLIMGIVPVLLIIIIVILLFTAL